MINYYKILGIKIFSDNSLEKYYNNSLKKYKNLPFYSIKIKDEIKKLKEAYYVLSTNKLKIIYDQKLKKVDQKLKKVDKKELSTDRDVLRNEYNNTICFRNFETYNKTVINLDKEFELKKSKLNINKKNNNYINE
tara:strand:- start:107 stop:511 length:405 start_codon:yes stop_codon:yes gene_type:complete